MKISATNTGPVSIESYGNGVLITIPEGAHVEIDGKTGAGQATDAPVDMTANTVVLDVPFKTEKYYVTAGPNTTVVVNIPVPADGKSLTIGVAEQPGSEPWHRTMSVRVNGQQRDDMNAGPDVAPQIPIGIGVPNGSKAVWIEPSVGVQATIKTVGANKAANMIVQVIADDSQR